MINPILGIDTWEGQLAIDESVLQANDVPFMFIRLNDMNGGHHRDLGFDTQWAQAANFYRTPYFVYNPWVDGQANFNWLNANMPPEAKAVALDIEVRMSGYSPTTYAAEFKKFYGLVKAKWNTVIYTGEWFLNALAYWPTEADYWWAQYPFEFYSGTPITLTWDELRTKLQKYEVPLNAAKCPGRIRFWQFSGDTLILPGNPKPMDVNVYFGTLDELQNFMGGDATPPPPTNGGSMTNLLVVANYLNGRDAPNGTINFPAGSTLSTGFRKDDQLEAAEFQIDPNGVTVWYRITKCTRAGGVIPLPATVWASDGGSYGYLKVVTVVPSVFISHTFSDTLTLNGITYTADFTVPNVEYKPTA